MESTAPVSLLAGPCGNVKKSPANSRISTGCCLSAGTAAIQVAKQIGAKIFTTAGSQEKLDFAKELGAHVLINYKEQDFAEVVKKETAGPEVKVSMHHVQPADGSECCGRLDAHIAWHECLIASVLFCCTLIGALPNKHVPITWACGVLPCCSFIYSFCLESERSISKMCASASEYMAYLLQAIPGGPKPAPGVNVILDLVGASHFSANLQSLTIEGKLLLVGVPSGVKAEIDLASVSPACCVFFLFFVSHDRPIVHGTIRWLPA